MTPEEHRQVYYPDEDSFLLADCVLSDSAGQRGLPDRPAIVELGVGTGAVLASAMQHLAPSAVYATDINPVACSVASRTLEEAALRITAELRPEVRVVQGDLFEPLGDAVFDLVMFNPPYVPSDSVATRGLEAGLGGGAQGREVIDRFLAALPAHLSRWGVLEQAASEGRNVGKGEAVWARGRVGGVAYLVCISANNIPGVIETCARNGLTAVQIAGKKLASETLCVLRITHSVG